MKKINFVNGSTPALNATNLNKLQDNIEDTLIINGYSNGLYYTKFPDGTMICFGSVNNITINANSSYEINVVLPESYIASVYAVNLEIYGNPTNWHKISKSFERVSNNTFKIYLYNSASAAATQALIYITIGRWK